MSEKNFNTKVTTSYPSPSLQLSEREAVDIAKHLKHVALIPDGNRRWAKEHNLPPDEGHRVGFLKVSPTILEELLKLGIHTITVWGSSSDNWKRNKEEMDHLMVTFQKLTNILFPLALKYRVKIVHLGRKNKIPGSLQVSLKTLEENTKDFDNHVLNLAIDYSGRDEICRAITKLYASHESKNPITEDVLSKYIDGASQPYPYPDLIIRSSGEQRISGFMAWQIAFSEFYFAKTYFPDFTIDTLMKALSSFVKRKRRFGGD